MGGARQKRFYTDMTMLDLAEGVWHKVCVVFFPFSCRTSESPNPIFQVAYAGGTAPVRSYHSCTLFRGELIFYGGNYPNPDPTPDGCSGDLDIFNIAKQIWYRPLTMGDVPPPRSGLAAAGLYTFLLPYPPQPLTRLFLLFFFRNHGAGTRPRCWQTRTRWCSLAGGTRPWRTTTRTCST
jgi:hypothetical protein